jgi:hypothetical protein
VSSRGLSQTTGDGAMPPRFVRAPTIVADGLRSQRRGPPEAISRWRGRHSPERRAPPGGSRGAPGQAQKIPTRGRVKAQRCGGDTRMPLPGMFRATFAILPDSAGREAAVRTCGDRHLRILSIRSLRPSRPSGLPGACALGRGLVPPYVLYAPPGGHGGLRPASTALCKSARWNAVTSWTT